MIKTSSLALAVYFLLWTNVHAAPPTITSIAPRGLTRGKPGNLVVQGTNISPKAQLWVPFPAKVETINPAKPTPNQVQFQVFVADDVPFGLYPVRLLDDDGVSSLTWIGVDPFPQGAEIEDNSTFDKAQAFTLPIILNGQCAGGDVDFFRFAAKKGQRLVIEAEAARLGSGVLPQLRLTDAKGRFLAADDSQKLRGDARVWFTTPTDGEYVIELSDTRYRGGNPPFYRLKIGEYDAAQEIFPLGGQRGAAVEFKLRGGNLDKELRLTRTLNPFLAGWPFPRIRPLDAGPELRPGTEAPWVAVGEHPEILVAGKEAVDQGLKVSPPVTINGRLEQRGHGQRFHFPVQEGQRWRFTVAAEGLGSHLDGVLRLLDGQGKTLAQADDTDIPAAVPGQPGVKSADPNLEFTVPKGLAHLTVELSDGREQGGLNCTYRLTIEPAEPDFVLRPELTEINVPRNGVALVRANLQRRGYAGPIQLSLAGLPAGFDVSGGYIPAGMNGGLLTLRQTKPGALPNQLASVRLEGRALEPGSKIQRTAEVRLALSKEDVAASALPLQDLALALATPDPFAVRGPASVEVVNGYSVAVPLALTDLVPQKDNKPLPAVELLGVVATDQGKPAVAAVTLKPGQTTVGKNEGTLILVTPINVPEGRLLDVVPQGKTKIDGKDVLATGDALQVIAKPPFQSKVEPGALTLQPGQAQSITLKVERHALFKESITVAKVDGLPPGVALATPLKAIPADQKEIKLELKTDAKAASAKGTLTVSLTATIAGQAYAHPVLNVPFTLDAKK